MSRRWFVACALLLSACSFGTAIPKADKGVDRFHAMLNAGQSVAIYQGSARDMKDATPQDKMVRLLNAVHKRLGQFKSGKAVGWFDNLNGAGHFVTINYQAHYDRGDAQEQFVFRMAGDKPVLAGYHINSDALLFDDAPPSDSSVAGNAT